MSSFKKNLFKGLLFVLFLFLFVLVFYFIPLITVFLRGIPLDTEINPSYLNGMITASGVFLGFLSTIVISKSDTLNYPDYVIIVCDFVFFLTAIMKVFDAQISNKTTVNELVWVVGSIYATSGTVILLIVRLKRLANSQRN